MALGQRAIAVPTLAFASVNRALPVLRLGIRRGGPTLGFRPQPKVLAATDQLSVFSESRLDHSTHRITLENH
jgi:hypothetical protein